MDGQVSEPDRQRGGHTDAQAAEPAVTTSARRTDPSPIRARFESLVPARLDEATLLRRRFASWLRRLPLDLDSGTDILLAGYEAVGNAVMHAYPGRRGRVRLYAVWAGDTVEVVVTDWGCGIPPNRGHRTDPPTSGHGLGLIESVTDRMTIETGEHGTRLTMLWRAAIPASAL
ncbi:ATP-binding protein [Amycolatopsis kentuckyensis]|uniref:ATP-binding protein n=1 Tax=Amycolatopsis kentuckyensis TaxID=218823 RepID=UPI001FC98070|nr:ATP-binding protein [Amycolatopsis kentuckyensis]